MRILFIGNSHTYYNDLPAIVKELMTENGIACEVTMLAHGGWFLDQHLTEPETSFNIRYGSYDFVVLQEHSHPFGPASRYRDAVLELDKMIRASGAVTVIYSAWAMKAEPEKQAVMDRVNESIAEETGAVLVPVGQTWFSYMREHPDIEMYASDGAHASPAGSRFAASLIQNAIRGAL